MKKHPPPPFDTEAATRAVIAVSPGGRGFVVEARFPNPAKEKLAARGFIPSPFHTRRYIITAAHCLPYLPPPHRAAFPGEKTYPEWIGPLGSSPYIWAEC